MGRDVLSFDEVDQTQLALVGGKGANLGALARIEGIRVPAGFCVTTGAFRRVMATAPSIDGPLERLSHLKPDARDSIRALSAEVRQIIEGLPMPSELATAVTGAVARLGETAAYAVRSSATAEDLPTASFAGQQDTYLNVVGADAILRHIQKCWASLFTERAVTYRLRNGFDHRKIHMAVVVQRMVFPKASGILFTADPITGNRKVASVEATFGLGEALVSGLVNADVFKIRGGEIINKSIAAKPRALQASPSGGTQEQAIEPSQRGQPALSDTQVLQLAELGRRIEAHFGSPQDIEWCLADDTFQLVQSRPITTLFPIPTASDKENHVYVSVGHAQMMTDAMTPLGLSVWQMTTPRPMAEAGSRLFVDVTAQLAAPTSRASLLELFGRGDPLLRDALETFLDRGDDFIQPRADATPSDAPPAARAAAPLESDPAIVTALIQQTQASIAASKRDIRGKTGAALLDFIVADFQELRRVLFNPKGHQVFMSAIEATWWLNDHLLERLGGKNAADVLTQSVPNNITSEMGLALLDVADAIRPYPDVVKYLERIESDDFLNELPKASGGREARDAIQGWLDQYGMRCVGEIDITRPRWSERPSALVPLLLGNVRNFEPGAGKKRFEQGQLEAARKETELLNRLRALPDGAQKADETKRMIDRVRTFIGYREYPKYGMVSRYFVYKQALLEEAERMVEAGVLHQKEDIYYLRFQELHDVARTGHADHALIRARRAAFRAHQSLKPPRVLTSDGEGLSGTWRRTDLPTGALVGLAVSAGTVEGRARVILDMAQADLEPGDILVTAYTDPSWTPLFVAIQGLVTEVGGQMTHGAVIAREYGLPAVVAVENATLRIRDGQRIRVHGTDGYVELLD